MSEGKGDATILSTACTNHWIAFMFAGEGIRVYAGCLSCHELSGFCRYDRSYFGPKVIHNNYRDTRRRELNMSSAVKVGQIVMVVYALLMLGGGIGGYATAHSKPSLISGVLSAV